MQHTALTIYKFRYAFLFPIALVILMLTSALVTALGHGTPLDAKQYPSAPTVVSSSMADPDFVSDGVSHITTNIGNGVLATGMHIYRACKTITVVGGETGQAAAHGTGTAIRGVGVGLVWVVRGVGIGLWTGVKGVGAVVGFGVRGVGTVVGFGMRGVGSVMGFVFRLPGKAIGSVTHGATVNALIQPTTSAKKSTTPVIDAETSNVILAKFNAGQQKLISDQLAQQLAANQALDGSVVAGDPHHGGYPAKWDTPVAQDSLIDSWGMYNRECVSYAAWKVYQTYGNMPYWGGVGNANQWLADARNTGIPTGATPKVHSVAISMRGYYGHAMWVEAVNGDMIYVSQYNYDLHGNYSEMWVKASNFTYIYFQ